jgi:hypothetical protein
MDKGVAEGVLMSKFLVLYRSSVSAREQMANATPEQAQAGMQAWQAWARRLDRRPRVLAIPGMEA